MQPYQEASEEIRRQGELPLKIAKGIGGIASAGIPLAATGLATKALSLVNKYVPEALAIKGLNKLDPRFGEFIQTAMDNGKSFDEIRDFLTDKAEEGLQQANQQPIQNQRKSIQQYSPELFQFLQQQIANGQDVKTASLLAKSDKKFANPIQALEKDYKKTLGDIVLETFGQDAKGIQAQQPSSVQGANGGNGKQAFLAIMDQLRQKLGE